MRIEIYISTSGGVISDVRARRIGADAGLGVVYSCSIVDYDDLEAANEQRFTMGQEARTQEEFERAWLDGHTWAEVEEFAVPVL